MRSYPEHRSGDAVFTGLTRAGAAPGLSAEIELVRARLVERLRSRRATDRFIHDQLTLLARLSLADARLRQAEPVDSAARFEAACAGPLAPLLAIISGDGEDQGRDTP